MQNGTSRPVQGMPVRPGDVWKSLSNARADEAYKEWNGRCGTLLASTGTARGPEGRLNPKP